MSGKFSGIVGSKSRLRSSVEKSKRREHDAIEERLYDDPNLLKLGITPDNCLFKAKEFQLPPSLSEDRSGYLPPADLVFFYSLGSPNQLHLLVLDVKSNVVNSRSFDHREGQMRRYITYFSGMWRTFLIHQVTPSRILQRTSEMDGDVYLSVGSVTKEFGTSDYPIFWDIRNERLGRVHNSGEKLLYTN